jgi:hypothetical protein
MQYSISNLNAFIPLISIGFLFIILIIIKNLAASIPDPNPNPNPNPNSNPNTEDMDMYMDMDMDRTYINIKFDAGLTSSWLARYSIFTSNYLR